MADAHANFAATTVATAPSPATSGTSLVVATGDGAKFPAAPFNATICPASTQPTTANAEIVRVTAVATDTLTITRTQESTSARTVVVGDQIFAGITSKTLTDAEASSVYGNGADGVVALSSGTTTLTRDMFYDTLTLSGTAILKPAGYRIWVKNTLTVGASCIIDCTGATGTNPLGASAAGNSIGSGGNGGSSSVTTGANGSNAASSAPNGGAGGAGGAGSGGAAGSGGTAPLIGSGSSNGNAGNAFPFCFFGVVIANAGPTVIRGGAGGGGGGGNGAVSGGGGGAGGTPLVINARLLVNNGIIRANGGDGGAGTTGFNTGGGGGGGGGVLVVNTTSNTGSGTITAAGGAGGAGVGTGVSGTNGTAATPTVNVWI